MTMLYARELQEIARLINETARLIKEKEAINEEKRNEIARLIKEKRNEHKWREKVYSTSLAQYSEKIVCLDAERVATLNNRALIEIGMLRTYVTAI